MTMTATIALSPSTANTGQKSVATVTVSNSGGSIVTVNAIEGNALASSGTSLAAQSVDVNLGRCNAGGPGVTSTVAASGSSTFTFDVLPNSPVMGTYTNNPFPSGITPLPALAQPTQQLVSIGAVVSSSDGSIVVATPATLTVNGLAR